MIEYHDAYLAPLIEAKPEWETRAIADVALLGAFADPWPDKLAMLRAYILCCLESLADENDVFSAKLKQYRPEFAATLNAARNAALVGPVDPGDYLFVPLERG